MLHEIAVLLNEEEKTTNFSANGKVVVFTRKCGKWQISRMKPVNLENVQGMADLRKEIGEILDFLGECRIIVGSKINGVPAMILSQANCKICEHPGSPIELMDKINVKEEACLIENQDSGEIKNQDSGKNTMELPSYEEFSPGRYRVSIEQIQRSDTQITSKQALLPFIRQKDFVTLEISCIHVPPWLEAEALARQYIMRIVVESENHVRVQLTKSYPIKECIQRSK